MFDNAGNIMSSDPTSTTLNDCASRPSTTTTHHTARSLVSSSSAAYLAPPYGHPSFDEFGKSYPYGHSTLGVGFNFAALPGELLPWGDQPPNAGAGQAGGGGGGDCSISLLEVDMIGRQVGEEGGGEQEFEEDQVGSLPGLDGFENWINGPYDRHPDELITSTSRSSSLSTIDTFSSTSNTSPAVSTCDIFAPQPLMRAAAVSYDFDPALLFLDARENPTQGENTFSLEPNIDFKTPAAVPFSRVDPPSTTTITKQLYLSPESLTSSRSTADRASSTRKSTRKRAAPGSYVDKHPLDSLPLDDETSSTGGPSEKKIKLVIGGGKGDEKKKEVKKEVEESEGVEVGKKAGEKEDRSAMSKKDRRRATNRASAAAFRNRRKNLVADLQRQVEERGAEIVELTRSVQELRLRNEQLHARNAALANSLRST